jgi:hypothetical protein
MNRPTLAVTAAGVFRLGSRLRDPNHGWEIDMTIGGASLYLLVRKAGRAWPVYY